MSMLIIKRSCRVVVTTTSERAVDILSCRAGGNLTEDLREHVGLLLEVVAHLCDGGAGVAGDHQAMEEDDEGPREPVFGVELLDPTPSPLRTLLGKLRRFASWRGSSRSIPEVTVDPVEPLEPAPAPRPVRARCPAIHLSVPNKMESTGQSYSAAITGTSPCTKPPQSRCLYPAIPTSRGERPPVAL
jgi:hypothetical protein